MTDTPLERFHLALVEALRERGPADLERPFTVAEIYQDLVPYRTHRDMLGIEMNGDYEHILLRLLSGEGGLLKLESEHALAEIREELDALDPNTGLYREFAAVDVRLIPSAIPDGQPRSNGSSPESSSSADRANAAEVEESSDSPDEDSDRSRLETVPLGAFDDDDDRGTLVGLDSLAPDHPEVPAAASRTSLAEPVPAFEGGAGMDADEVAGDSAVTGAGSTDASACGWCREELPPREGLHFCPFCGQDVHMQPCRSCGEALERGWRFCISCGAEAAD